MTAAPPETGIPSFCSSNEFVIKAALEYAGEHDKFVLIEATANQVNQYGGYTGMKPADFKNYVYRLAEHIDCGREKIILGGDHLGPVAFKHLTEKEAMREAEILIEEFVSAGFEKIHIDTSMRLEDDEKDSALPDETIARRGARLCAAAEKTYEMIFGETAKFYMFWAAKCPCPEELAGKMKL